MGESSVEFTPLDAPILCLVCTPNAVGSRLVATVNLRLCSSLADARSILTSLAHGGDGGSAAVHADPVNVTATQAATILASPLHPYDLTEAFRFVHAGGCLAYSQSEEAALRVFDVLPRFPRFGPPNVAASSTTCLPSSNTHLYPVGNGTQLWTRQRVKSNCTAWIPNGSPPLVTVPYQRSDRRRRKAGDSSSTVQAAATQRRMALAVLFVAVGDGTDGIFRLESVVAERLQLQLSPSTSLENRGSSLLPGLLSTSGFVSYGRPFQMDSWCRRVTRWNMNVEDFLGRTLLQEASQFGYESVVRFLVAQPHIEVDAAERQGGCTALHLAVKSNHPVIAQVLIEEGGASPLTVDHHGDTPLHIALRRKRATLVGLLCKRLRALGVSPEVLRSEMMRNCDGYTPYDLFALLSPSLMDLCLTGAGTAALTSLVNHYLFAKDDLYSIDGLLGRSVVHNAAEGGSVETLRYVGIELQVIPFLISKPHLLTDYRGQTPLHVAAAGGHCECVRLLMAELPTFCLSRQDANGDTPLLTAIKSRRWRVVELLLAQCASGTIGAPMKDRLGFTALHWVCSLGMTRAAGTLLRQHRAPVTETSMSPSASIWGDGFENSCIVRSSLVKGRHRQLQMREAKRNEVVCRRLTTLQQARFEEGTNVERVVAASHYPYGGGRHSSTPLRCALLYANKSGCVPHELLRLLCECGALTSDNPADMRDLLFFLVLHYTDGACQALLDSLVSHYATTVVLEPLLRDNTLLCRFCCLHHAVGVRWCIERRLCSLNDTALNPLVIAAAVGDAATVTFLLHHAGADVNAAAGAHSALGTALQKGHCDVAQLLIQAKARLTLSDGSWSALHQATVFHLEPVMRGMLGLDTLDTTDVARTLLLTLQSLVYLKPSLKAERVRLATYLARHYHPTASTVHPTELLHLSASVRAFSVTHIIAERLMELPTTVWAEILSSTPAPPLRPTTRVEPTVVPSSAKLERLLPSRITGRGGLYRVPRPFDRLTLPHFRQAAQTTLFHRVKIRDVYSYAAEAKDEGLVELLRSGLRLPPWQGPDLRGWTATDYSMAFSGSTRLLSFFVAAGIVPSRRHNRRLQPGSTALLARAIYDAQHAAALWRGRASLHKEGEARDGAEEMSQQQTVLATSLSYLASSKMAESLPAFQSIVDAFCSLNYIPNKGLTWFTWLAPVIFACVGARRLDLLALLTEQYGVDFKPRTTLALPTNDKVAISPLLMAAYLNDLDLASFLLRAGCPAHQGSNMTSTMSRHVPLKNSTELVITPVCLAAWMQHYNMLQLLVSASPFLASDTMEIVGQRAGDALYALVAGADRGLASQRDAPMASCVRAMAAAGHPLRSSRTLCEAVSKGFIETAESLVECYGAAALIADLVVPLPTEDEEVAEDKASHLAFLSEKSLGPPTALSYFASEDRLVPLLRSLLVDCFTDDYGAMTWVRSSAGKQLCSMAQSADVRRARIGGAAVDYALSRGCAEGAVLLMALGFVGRGVGLRVGVKLTQRSVLCPQLSAVLRHYRRRRCQYTHYSVLLGAVELGYGGVVEALVQEGVSLNLSPLEGILGTNQTSPLPSSAPSLYALAAMHRDGWRWLPSLELSCGIVNQAALHLTARDFLVLIFSGFGVSQVIDAACKRAAQQKLLGDMFSLYEVPLKDASERKEGNLSQPGVAWSAAFVANVLQRQPQCFYLASNTFLLTGMTPLTCAIAAGSLEWVQYVSSYGPLLVYHRACATPLSTTSQRRVVAAESPSLHRLRRWRSGGAKKPQHRRHCCATKNLPSLVLSPSGKECMLEAVVLSMALLAEAFLGRRTAQESAQEGILHFLLSRPGTVLRKETINVLAITAAALGHWKLLRLIMGHADRMYQGSVEEGDGSVKAQHQHLPRYFFALLPAEIPAVLTCVVGGARHVMHVAARGAPKEILVEVAQHCQREDVEAACDGLGRTSVYHVLQNAHQYAFDIFVALRIPMKEPCCTKRRQTPLMVAASLGRMSLVTALVKPERLNQQDRSGKTALMLAAAHGHQAIVEVLLASGADAGLVDARGYTAPMLAALGGHDELAMHLAQNFCRANDLVTAQSSLLHCAAVGGCWRCVSVCIKLMLPSADPKGPITRERNSVPGLILREDHYGNTPLYLAHAFGSARVLRLFLQSLFQAYGGDRRKLQLWMKANTGEVEQRIARCDSAIERYGWLRGVLCINGVLEQAARERYGASPASKATRFGELVYQAIAPAFSATSLLSWCVKANNAVGVRVLADFNVVDDSGALFTASATGHLGIVKLLIELEMSNPSIRDPVTERYAFEIAALAGYKDCAAYLLNHTVFNLTELLLPMRSDVVAPEERAEVENLSAGRNNTLFHVMAGHCGGELLVQFFQLTMESASRTYIPIQNDSGSGVEVLMLYLYTALQRSGETGLTPLEYAIAMGDPAAVLRTSQILLQLHEQVVAQKKLLKYDRVQHTDVNINGVDDTIGALFPSHSLPTWLPTVSPAVRTVLYDVFGMTNVAVSAGLGPVPSPLALTTESSSITAVTAPRAAVASGSLEIKTPQRSTLQAECHRLSFGDVRLIGVSHLQENAYCAELLAHVFSNDREREVLRNLLRGFPLRIRYEPESFGRCTPAVQAQLLRWLGSTLVLSLYEGVMPGGEIDAVEIVIVSQREAEFARYQESTLFHSLYVSTSQHQLAMPMIVETLPATINAYRKLLQHQLSRATKKVTRLLHRMPHPVLQQAVVLVEWNLSSLPIGVESAWTNRQRLEAAVSRVCCGLDELFNIIRGPVQSLLREVQAADLSAVVAGVREDVAAHPTTIVFRYVDTDIIDRYPPSATLVGKESAYPSCVIDFNRETMMDVQHVWRRTLLPPLESDVVLVRVHHARDRFLRMARRALETPRGVAVRTSPSQTGSSQETKIDIASTQLQFKLELEGAALSQLPVAALEHMLLHEAVAGIEAVASPVPPAAALPRASTKQHGKSPLVYSDFHSAAILSSALTRRLRHVLVLFTTRRDAMVSLNGDKLMLCFTKDEAPNRSDITKELQNTITKEECEQHRRRLTEIYEVLSQRLSAYLPRAQLTINLDAIERLSGDPAHFLSALSLLVFNHSEYALQRLVEGVSIGWDAELGSVIRRHVRQITLTLENSPCGTCYLSPGGIFVYYCPLLCMERRRHYGLVTSTSLPSWQLLSAQHIASLLLLQLAVREPSIKRLIDAKSSASCWTTARRDPKPITPGKRVTIHVQIYNILRRPLHRSDETLKLMGQFSDLKVTGGKRGRYMVRFNAPERAGSYRLYLLLSGQPIAQSPLTYVVLPGPVDLDHTKIEAKFNAVVVRQPFEVLLRLQDRQGNCLRSLPRTFAVKCTNPSPTVVKLRNWSVHGPGTVSVVLTVLSSPPTTDETSYPALQITLQLSTASVSQEDPAGSMAASVAPTNVSSVSLPPWSCVTARAYAEVRRVRAGMPLDRDRAFPQQRSPTAGNGWDDGSHEANSPIGVGRSFPISSVPTHLATSNLFFRPTVRIDAVRRIERDTARLNGAVGFVFPQRKRISRILQHKVEKRGANMHENKY